MRFTKKIVERGNVTLPSDLREALGIEDGDFVEFEIIRVLKKASDGGAAQPQTIGGRTFAVSRTFDPEMRK